MRSLSTEGLEPLGEKGHGPWRLDEGLLLRTERLREPLATCAEAQEVFDAYQAAQAAGVRAPRPVEVVRVGDGYGVVVEYMQGVSLGAHAIIGSYSLEEAGRELGTLARRLHAIRARGGTDVNAAFCAWARTMGRYLPADCGQRLAEMVAAVPRSHAFLHADLHPGNVIVCGGELALIDMELSGFGNPTFDLAIMRARLIFGATFLGGRVGLDAAASGDAAWTIWHAVLACYLGDPQPDVVADADKRLEILAEVENCCFGWMVQGDEPSRLTDAQRVRVNRATARICELLPQVDSLALPV